MNRNLTANVVTVCALVLAGVGAALADEGKIPLFEPSTITQPGHYLVTRDIDTATGPVFDIQADGVRLDLGGHTLNLSSAAADVIRISSGGSARGIEIVNGRIKGGYNGVATLTEPLDKILLTLRDLRVTGATEAGISVRAVGMLQAKGLIIVDNKFGFDLQGDAGIPASAVLEDIHINGASERGIIEDNLDMLAAREIIIVDSKVALDLSNTSGREASARIEGIEVGPGDGGEAPGGVWCEEVACSVVNGLLRVPFDNDRPAIRFTNVSGGAVKNLLIRATSRMGTVPSPFIELLGSKGIIVDDNVIRGPASSSSGNHGIFVDTASMDVMIRGNTVTGCGDDGIHVLASGVSIRDNLVNRNESSGIFVGGADNLIERNRIGLNDGDGIYFDNAVGPHIYLDNILRGNIGSAVGGSTDNTDAGGNVL